MPTEVKSHNSFVYLFNPYEEHFLIEVLEVLLYLNIEKHMTI